MGMSIDEHIGVIKDLKDTMSVCMSEPEKTEICISLSEAIETMRKYQKIKKIVFGDFEKGYQYAETVHRIRKVLESEE